MDSVDTFIHEMMESVDTERYIQQILNEMAEPSIPDLQKVLKGYDCMTKLHGVKLNRDEREATIQYCVVSDAYPAVTLSYERMEVLLEGLLCCRRKRKW